MQLVGIARVNIGMDWQTDVTNQVATHGDHPDVEQDYDSGDDLIPRPTGSRPVVAMHAREMSHATSATADSEPVSVGRWWAAVLTAELRPPQARASQATIAAIRRHRTEDDTADPLIVPSEWGVF